MKDLKKKAEIIAKKTIVVVRKDDVIGRRLVRQEADIKASGYDRAVNERSTLRKEFYRVGSIVY